MVVDFILSIASSWWVIPALALFACIDGFFPPVPAESLITALASLSSSAHVVPLWSVWIAGVVGATVGDSIAFWLGRKLPIESIPLVRKVATDERLEFARRELQLRGASYLLAARFVPVGRVLVNMTAGASGFKYPKFLPVSFVASTVWAGFAVVIGWGTGRIISDRPVLAMIVGIAVGVVVGLIFDRVASAFRKSHS
ncbi:DedA family protein [Boudabousia marimammalium]|uniref:VTT domain-containing protein n=1 Tax=Boudabousia marimammalium TaxID=156892 RepID=A0A1Q5PJI1_9ACTO|nr:DedA family protein [Boudabousia marimammalium]OKL46051.1 hypothetical protein BM477_07690 [Boudabousia marimammalium]